MWPLCSLLLLLLLSIFDLVATQGSNSFTVPSDGFNVTAGKSYTVEWTDPSQSTVTIQLTRISGTGTGITLGSTLPNNGRATLPIPSDVSTTQQYRFRIIDDTNSSNTQISVPFTISPPNASALPSTSATSTTSTTAVTSTSTSTSTASANPSLSSSAIAGISAGAVLGTCVLIGIAIFFIWRRRRHKIWQAQQREQQQEQDQEEQQRRQQEYSQVQCRLEAAELQDGHPVTYHGTRSEMVGNKTFPGEMEGTSRNHQMEVAELPGHDISAEGEKPSNA